MTSIPAEGTAIPWFVGAYAALPKEWDASVQQRLLGEFAAAPEFSGWEVPFVHSLHPHDETWFLDILEPDVELVVTLIPGVVGQLASDPSFGLASTDEAGRQRAVQFASEALAAVNRANERLGRLVVRAVELHSAPPAVGSPDRLRTSLAQIAGWDWAGTELLLEHCDAARVGQKASKGFLGIEDEIAVVADVQEQSGTRLGVLVNWGRSAIEGRNAATATEHIALAHDAGLLRGLMFSGCSGDAASRGGAWADMHLPPQLTAPDAEPSLLDEAAIANALTAAGSLTELAVFGMKIGCPPGSTPEKRGQIVTASAALILEIATAPSFI